MASDQRRKRLNGANMVGYGSLEQCRTKRKNFGPPMQSDLTMKSHISVEWDANHQRVVAKREQIGISWRQMKPFARFDHNGHEVLADVLAIPEEIFDLDNLSGVLSSEVWNTHLLDNERDFLKQFLPGDLEPHQVVQELLSGDDFHFGNPFLKWGASLCSGELHPDMIVYQEQHLKADKRAYFLQLQNYHKDMIGFLIKLKERWESCKDPEKEILPNTLRSKNDIEKRKLSHLNEFRDDDHDENITVTSGDSQISSKGQGDELQRRVLGKDFNKGNPRNMMASDFMLNVGGKPKKGGTLPKENIHASDGDKYMSYIKISKKQHELVKGLKLSCKSIPASTLNCVLGDLDNFNAQPYNLFIKEEQKNLHEHWLQLVKKHLPASYANWTKRLIEKRAMKNSLLLEMKNKPNVLVEDEDILSTGVQAQDKEDGGVNKQSSLEDEDSLVTIPENPSLHNFYHSGDDELHHLQIDSKKDILSKGDDALHNITGLSSIMNCQDDPIYEGASFSSDEDSIARFQENPSLLNSYHSSDKELRRLHKDLEQNILSKGDDASKNKAGHSRSTHFQKDPIDEGASFSSDEDSIARFQENPSLLNSYHSGDKELRRLNKDLEQSILSKGDDASQNKAGHSRITHFQKDPIGEEASFSYNEDSISRFPENPSVNKSYSSGDQELHSLHIDLEKNILSKADDAAQNKTEHSQIMHSQDDPMDEGAPFSYNEDYVARFPENLAVSKSYHSGDEELHRLHIDLEKDILSNVDVSQIKTEHSRNMNSRDDSIGEGSSNGHAWQAVEMPHSYYDLAATHNYSAGGLSLVNSQINLDKQIQMIGPEPNFHHEVTGKELLHRQSADGSFSSYRSQDQVGSIQSLIKDKGVNSYHHEQKRAGLIFQASNDVPMVDGQFSSHFKESLQTSPTLDQGQRQAGNFYVPENVPGNIYSDAGRYSIPRQDPLSAGNISDWAVNAPRMVTPSQPHVNTGDFIGQPWFSSDRQVQGAWNGSGNVSLPSQSLGTGGNSDQSLYSLLSQRNQLRSGSPYDSIRHTDQFLSPRTYVVDASTHRINTVVPPSSNPLDYLNGRDAPGALVPDDMTWMSLPPQNHALNDQVAKAYLRSWNR